MNRHTVITGIALAVIVAAFAYSGMSVYAADQLQYRWGIDQFSFFAMSNGGHVEFCNSVPVWADIRGFRADLYYDGTDLGSFSTEPASMGPSSSVMRFGTFSSERFVAAQHMLMSLDHIFDGGDVRLDPSRMNVLVTIDTPILGIIPYSTTTQHTGIGFDEMMNGAGFECQGSSVAPAAP